MARNTITTGRQKLMERYEKYKDSGVEWIGEIPEHWNSDQLGWQGIFSASGIDKKTVKKEPLVKMINYTDIYGNDKQTLTAERKYMIVSCPETKRQNHQVNIGDLVFTPSSETIEDIGLSALVVEELIDTVYSYHVIRLQFINDFDVNFRKYLCNNNFVLSQFSKEAKGTTRQIIGRDVFKNINIVVPPKTEQTAISNYLDRKTVEIEKLISQKECLLELYEEEKIAIINQSVTGKLKIKNEKLKMKDSGIDWLGEIPEHWEVKKLKYVAKINPFKNNAVDKNLSELVVFLPMEKVSEDGSIDCEIKKPICNLYNGFTFFQKNDVIVAKITPCFENGKGAYLDNLETKLGFGSTEFHVLRANNNTNSKFLYFITKSELFMKIGEAFMTGAAGQKRVPTDFVSEFQVAFPKIEEQTQIVQHIEKETARIDVKIEKGKRLIALLKEYRTALISEVVTGKVKVV